jgi:hypothetical protein
MEIQIFAPTEGASLTDITTGRLHRETIHHYFIYCHQPKPGYMKPLMYLLVLFMINSNAYSQQKLKNGIYLVDQSPKGYSISASTNKTSIRFHPLFVDDDPELYEPVVILTDDYVPLDLSGVSLVESQISPNKMLQLQLTDSATRKLTAFTKTISKKYVVIVVNGDALTMHEIQDPVTSGLITLTKCRNNACEQFCNTLKKVNKCR